MSREPPKGVVYCPSTCRTFIMISQRLSNDKPIDQNVPTHVASPSGPVVSHMVPITPAPTLPIPLEGPKPTTTPAVARRIWLWPPTAALLESQLIAAASRSSDATSQEPIPPNEDPQIPEKNPDLAPLSASEATHPAAAQPLPTADDDEGQCSDSDSTTIASSRWMGPAAKRQRTWVPVVRPRPAINDISTPAAAPLVSQATNAPSAETELTLPIIDSPVASIQPSMPSSLQSQPRDRSTGFSRPLKWVPVKPKLGVDAIGSSISYATVNVSCFEEAVLVCYPKRSHRIQASTEVVFSLGEKIGCLLNELKALTSNAAAPSECLPLGLTLLSTTNEFQDRLRELIDGYRASLDSNPDEELMSYANGVNYASEELVEILSTSSRPSSRMSDSSEVSDFEVLND